LVIGSRSLGAEKKGVSAELTNAVLGKSFVMRQTSNVAAKQYYRLGQKEFLCRHKLSGLFPNRQDVSDVSIIRVREGSETEILSRTTKLEGNRMVSKEITKEYRFWVFTLKHPHLGKGEFRVTTSTGELPDNPAEVLDVLGFVFLGEGLPQHVLLRARTGSALVHFVGSGHAPEGTNTVDFGNLEGSSKAGYKACSLCFNRGLRLANLETEFELGRETEATIRHYYQVSKDAQLQERVERLGNKVLANWPTKPIGFEYRFNVIENRRFNAVACAGGFIFINSGLVSLVESDEELESVLAHEIAHVEQRHGIKELIRARRNARTAAILGAVVTGAAAAAAASTDNKQVATGVAEASAAFGIWLYAVGAQIALQGYSREHEMEADIWASNYLQKMGYNRSRIVSVLQKVRTSVDLENPRSSNETDLASSHPSPNNRIHIAKTLEIEHWPKAVVFDVFNKEDELVYSIGFNGVCSYSRRDGSDYCMVLLDVSSTAVLGDPKSADELTLTFENQSRRFTADGPYEVSPMDRIGMTFTYKGKLLLTPEGISAPRLTDLEGTRIIRRETSDSSN